MADAVMIAFLIGGLAALVILPAVAVCLFMLGFSGLVEMIARGEGHDRKK